jgi:hypothetical protein
MMKTALVTKTDTGWQVCFTEFEGDEPVYSKTVAFDTETAARSASYHYLMDYEDHLTFED